MRLWLLLLSIAILVLLGLGIAAYTNLGGRLAGLERGVTGGPAGTPAGPVEEPGPGAREVSVFFPRLEDQEVRLAAVSREVSAEAPAAGALRELLQGPTEEERQRGLHTEIPSGTELEGLTIENGTARAVFNSELDRGVAGSLRVITIRRQIEQTLLQFPTIDEVVIEVDGRTEDVLQP